MSRHRFPETVWLSAGSSWLPDNFPRKPTSLAQHHPARETWRQFPAQTLNKAFRCYNMTGPTYKNIRSAPWVLTLRFPSNGSKRTMLFGLSQWLGIFVLINPSSSLLEPSSFKSDQLINQKSVVWVFFFFSTLLPALSLSSGSIIPTSTLWAPAIFQAPGLQRCVNTAPTLEQLPIGQRQTSTQS